MDGRRMRSGRDGGQISPYEGGLNNPLTVFSVRSKGVVMDDLGASGVHTELSALHAKNFI